MIEPASARSRMTRAWTVAVTMAVALASAIVAAAGPVGAAADPRAGHGFGARRPTARVTPSRLRQASGSLPPRVDLRAWSVPVGNQGQVASCVTWAIDYAMLGWYSRRDGKGGSPFAPMYTYSQINGGRDEGSYPIDALNVARTQGTDTRADYVQGDYNWRTRPTKVQRAHATNYRIAGYHTLFAGYGGSGRDRLGWGATGAAQIKAALAAGKPVAIGLVVRRGFYNLGARPAIDTDTTTTLFADGSLALHEVLALGYDASGLIIQNSWGTGWGDGGFARLSWPKVAADVDEAYTIDGFATLPVAKVTRLSATYGAPAGGTTVVVTGTTLRSASTVRFGATAAPILAVDATGTHLRVTAPAHTAGTVDVTVWTGRRSSPVTPASRFTYLVPPIRHAS